MQFSFFEEKRTVSRRNVNLLLNKYLHGRPYACRISNLSRKGLLLHPIREPSRSNPSSPTIGLQFQIPTAERIITCVGRIVHTAVDGNSQGVEFTNIAPEHRQLIAEFLVD